jgi:acetoin utilization protein AcuC
MTSSDPKLGVYGGAALAAYGFGAQHPLGTDRLPAFWEEYLRLGLDRISRFMPPVQASEQDLLLFHTQAYLDQVKALSAIGQGVLDGGDTPAVCGIWEAALTVAGSVLDGLEQILAGRIERAFVPIAGLHHARPGRAAGFCVLNDCALAIHHLRKRHGIQKIAYVDIDAHHGDGVFYAFEDDADCFIADLHEDGRFLFPGSGAANECGMGRAAGSKMNIPLPPGADDALFNSAWQRVEAFLIKAEVQFILFQCGADSLAGDPLTDLALSSASHEKAARSLCRIADTFCQGRLLAMGGGGYNKHNINEAWCKVVRVLAQD